MVRKPINFETWLDFHFNSGIDYIFLNIEDTPELKKVTDNYPNVFAKFTQLSNNHNNYWTLIDRQVEFINSIKEKVMDLKIEWLFHIDVDELICCNDISILLKSIPEDINVARFKNYEAVYSEDNLQNPFLQTNQFRVTGHLAYFNGKSASRVTEFLKPKGSHLFEGKRIDIQAKDGVILHFESPTFESWYEKFSNESKIDDSKLSEIPFEFYRESIDIIRTSDKIVAKQYYNQKKVNIKQGIVQLSWMPLLKQKNITWIKN